MPVRLWSENKGWRWSCDYKRRCYFESFVAVSKFGSLRHGPSVLNSSDVMCCSSPSKPTADADGNYIFFLHLITESGPC